jgi:hypothetical protein
MPLGKGGPCTFLPNHPPLSRRLAGLPESTIVRPRSAVVHAADNTLYTLYRRSSIFTNPASVNPVTSRLELAPHDPGHGCTRCPFNMVQPEGRAAGVIGDCALVPGGTIATTQCMIACGDGAGLPATPRTRAAVHALCLSALLALNCRRARRAAYPPRSSHRAPRAPAPFTLDSLLEPQRALPQCKRVTLSRILRGRAAGGVHYDRWAPGRRRAGRTSEPVECSTHRTRHRLPFEGAVGPNTCNPLPAGPSIP